MLRMKERTRAILMMIHGLLMIGLGLGLLYIRARMTNLFYDVFGSVLGLLLAAESLLFGAVVDWISAAGMAPERVARLRGLLILSTVTAGASVVLIVRSDGSVRLLCYVIAANAFLLSIVKFYMAKHWKKIEGWSSASKLRPVTYALAAVAFFFSLLLVFLAPGDEHDSFGAIAIYALFSGIQMLITLFYIERNSLPLEAARIPGKVQ